MEKICSGGSCPIDQISWLWYTAAVLISFALGAFWYGKLFMKAWTKAIRFKCACGADLSKGEKCTCPPKPSYFATMALQLIATALIGLMYFVLTLVSVWLAVMVAIAVCGWMKATLKFQIQEFKRWVTLCAIDVGYFAVVSMLFILFALI